VNARDPVKTDPTAIVIDVVGPPVVWRLHELAALHGERGMLTKEVTQHRIHPGIATRWKPARLFRCRGSDCEAPVEFSDFPDATGRCRPANE
jgi:hypothetical protein